MIVESDWYEWQEHRGGTTWNVMQRVGERVEVMLEPDYEVPEGGCRCGSTEHRDTLIHNGQSVRRDCIHCRRFVSFPRWHGETT